MSTYTQMWSNFGHDLNAHDAFLYRDILKISDIEKRRGIVFELINAKGLGCAEPVILAKKALESHDEITIIVDATTALENLKALGMHTGCVVNVISESGEVYSVHFRKK